MLQHHIEEAPIGPPENQSHGGYQKKERADSGTENPDE
jgi:hypothetical protein